MLGAGNSIGNKKKAARLADQEIRHIESALSATVRQCSMSNVRGLGLIYWISRVNSIDIQYDLLPSQRVWLLRLSSALAAAASLAHAEIQAQRGPLFRPVGRSDGLLDARPKRSALRRTYEGWRIEVAFNWLNDADSVKQYDRVRQHCWLQWPLGQSCSYSSFVSQDFSLIPVRAGLPLSSQVPRLPEPTRQSKYKERRAGAERPQASG
jgi:hypothetical protein